MGDMRSRAEQQAVPRVDCSARQAFLPGRGVPFITGGEARGLQGLCDQTHCSFVLRHADGAFFRHVFVTAERAFDRCRQPDLSDNVWRRHLWYAYVLRALSAPTGMVGQLNLL